MSLIFASLGNKGARRTGSEYESSIPAKIEAYFALNLLAQDVLLVYCYFLNTLEVRSNVHVFESICVKVLNVLLQVKKKVDIYLVKSMHDF